jgi:hypothetical protein
MIENLNLNLSILIKLLLIPILVLGIILLYRLDRILNAGMHSAEAIERTAENVERSSETIYGVAALIEKIPYVGGKKKVEEDE